MSAKRLVACMALAMLGSACGGVSRQKSSPSAPPGMTMNTEASAPSESDYKSEADADPQAEISQLAREISEWRIESGLPAEPDSGVVRSMAGVDIAGIRSAAGAAEPTSSTCRDVCTISERICENALAICRLAESLGEDEWAQEKCDSGKASCKEATERCTACDSIARKR